MGALLVLFIPVAMKLTNHKSPDSPTLMIIPMIDIIFFLLVFFMLNMLNMVTQKTLPVALPQATSAKVDRTATLPVAIRADKTVFVEDQPVDLTALPSVLQSHFTAEGTPPVVVVRADRSVDVATLVAVFDVVHQSGIERVTLAAEGKAP